MTEPALEGRVTTLEDLMADVLRTLAHTEELLAEQAARSDEEFQRLREQLAERAARSDEEFQRLREQLAEQAARTDERLAQQAARSDEEFRRLREQLAEQAARTDERLAQMAARTDEQFRRTEEEIERVIREMRREWGKLSNKMGTMAEDLVAPSVPRILRQVIGCPDDAVDSVAVRVRRRHPETRQMQEFDVVATCGEYIFINETKSQLRPDHIERFVEVLKRAREYFPEYADRKIIGCIASLYVDPSLVRFGEREGLIVLGFGEDVMDVLNSPEFTPRIF